MKRLILLICVISLITACSEKASKSSNIAVSEYSQLKPIEQRITNEDVTNEAKQYVAYVDKTIKETIPLIEKRRTISPYDEENVQLTHIIMGNIKALRKAEDLSPIINCQIVGDAGADILSGLLSSAKATDHSLKHYNFVKNYCQRDINEILADEPVHYILLDVKTSPPSKECYRATLATRLDGKIHWDCPIK